MKLFARVIRRLRYIGVWLSVYFPPLVRWRLRHGGDVIVLYHGIDKDSSRIFNSRHIGVSEFHEHLVYFKNYFQIVPVADLLGSKPAGRPRLAITFDDGYLNNFDLAVPILELEGAPATIFVTAISALEESILWADFLDIFVRLYDGDVVTCGARVFHRRRKRHYDPFTDSAGVSLKSYLKTQPHSEKLRWMSILRDLVENWEEQLSEHSLYWRLVDNERLSEFGSSTVSIGSHGLSHDNLGNLPPKDAEAELKLSKSHLESLIGRQVHDIAYPDGSYNQGVKEMARAAGYRLQLATNYRIVSDEQEIDIRERVGLYSHLKRAELLSLVIAGTRRNV